MGNSPNIGRGFGWGGVNPGGQTLIAVPPDDTPLWKPAGQDDGSTDPMEPAHLVDARGKVSRGDQEEQAERPPGWRAPGDDARRPLGSQRARGRKGICAEWPRQRPQVLNGASVNGARGEERGLQPFSSPSDESIPELAGCQASAQLPAGLTPTCAQLGSSYLRGADILFSTERHWKPSYPLPPNREWDPGPPGREWQSWRRRDATSQRLHLGGSEQNQLESLSMGRLSLPTSPPFGWDSGESYL